MTALRRHSLVPLFATVAFVAVLAQAGRARAQDSSKPGKAEQAFVSCLNVPPNKVLPFTLKPEQTLRELIRWAAKITCKRFVISPSIRIPKLTIVSPRGMTPREVFKAFLSAIYTLGLTVVASGPVLKVLQVNAALFEDVPVLGSYQWAFPYDDRVITKVFAIEHVPVNSLMPVVNKLKHRRGDVTAYTPNNKLIVTDSANNMRRIAKIIKELDLPSAKDGIWWAKLQHVDATELKAVLLQLFFQNPLQRLPRLARSVTGAKLVAPDLPKATKIIDEPSLNALIFVARPADWLGIRKLVDQLDQPTTSKSKRRLHVLRVEHATAEDLAKALTQVAGASRNRRRTRRRRRGRRFSRYLGTPKGKSPLFRDQVQITADKKTNTLVVAATLGDFVRIRALAKQLDRARRQVFIEMAILEVTVNHNKRLGLAYHGGGITGSGDSQAIIFGGVQHQGLGSLLLDLSSLTGLSVGARGALIDGSAELLGLQADIPGIGVMFQALQTDSNVDVISAPHLLTTNNEKAEIIVGQNLPFQGGARGVPLSRARGALALPTIQVQRQDVALKIKITPHIGPRGTVRLELEMEKSDITSPNFNNLGPATSKRSIKSVVTLRDQQSAIVGGITSFRLSETVSKVPLLGDIPLLGWLFKHRSTTRQRTNIVAVLTPYVIDGPADLRRIFHRKMRQRQRFIRRYSTMTGARVSADIDYRHKHGLLAEIHRVARGTERDVAAVAEAKRALSGPRRSSGPRKAPPVPAASDD